RDCPPPAAARPAGLCAGRPGARAGRSAHAPGRGGSCTRGGILQRATPTRSVNYVVRTSEPKKRLSSEDAVRNYKRLAEVEQAFRSLKSSDLRVRPIRHRLAERVRAHVLLCMLAYYVQWHLKRAWEPLLFEEEDMQSIRNQRAPVAPAEPSAEVQEKKVTHQT